MKQANEEKQNNQQQTQDTLNNNNEQNHNNMLIKEIIDKMPQNIAMPIIMYLKGQKYNEIAKAMNITSTTARNRIHMAKCIIKKQKTKE